MKSEYSLITSVQVDLILIQGSLEALLFMVIETDPGAVIRNVFDFNI